MKTYGWTVGILGNLALFATLPALLFLGPYFYRLYTNPWAGDLVRKNTLTGTWYGYADPMTPTMLNKPSDITPASTGSFLVTLHLHMNYSGLSPSALGTITLCKVDTGQQHTYQVDSFLFRGGSTLSFDVTDKTNLVGGGSMNTLWNLDRLAFRLDTTGDAVYPSLKTNVLAGGLTKVAPASYNNSCQAE